MHNKLFLILLLVSVFSITSIQSQITEINGRKVEFKDDGTWRYIEENDNEEQSEDEKESVNPIQSSTDKFKSRKSSQQQRNTQNRVSCSDLISVDLMPDLSGLQRQSEEVFVIGKNSFFMNWTHCDRDGLLLNIQFKNPKCISEMDKVSFYFRDLSENFTVSNIATPNCEGFIKIQDKKALSVLGSEKIKSISIRTKEGIFTEYISEINAMSMIESTNCILKITETK